jgi:hypothetical protein
MAWEHSMQSYLEKTGFKGKKHELSHLAGKASVEGKGRFLQQYRFIMYFGAVQCNHNRRISGIDTIITPSRMYLSILTIILAISIVLASNLYSAIYMAFAAFSAR